MSNNEEVRHAAVKALHDIMQSVPCSSLYSLAEAVLDAGYAAPVVERQPVAYLVTDIYGQKKALRAGAEGIERHRNSGSTLVPLFDYPISQVAVDDGWYTDECGNLRYRPEEAPPAPVAVPDGWKLVPIEPTAEMLSAAERKEWPADWEAGKRLQRLRGLDVVSPRTETECAVGLYGRILEAAPEYDGKVKELNQ